MNLSFPKRPGFDSLLRACILAVAAAVALAAGGRFDWRLDLFTHWRLQYFAAAVVLLFLLLVRRQYRFAMFAAVIVVVNAAGVGYPTRALAADAGRMVEGSGRHFRLVHYNVLFSNREYATTLDWLRRTKPDLISLVEVDDGWNVAMAPLKADLPYTVQADGDDGTGLKMYSRFPLVRSSALAIGTLVQHAIITGVSVGGREITFVGGHPWPPISNIKVHERDEYLARIAALVRNVDGPVLVAADLNTTPWSHIYGEFLASANLTGREPIATWPAPLGFFGIPIDHILGRRVMIDSTTAGPNLGSDHRPVIAEISF